MIQATVNENDEIIIDGRMNEGDVVPGFCCRGHNWTVVRIFPDPNPADVSVWGQCDNPNCTEDPGGMYQGVYHQSVGDMAEWLIEHEVMCHVCQRDVQ
jgi:hypothetical protein